MSIGRPWLTRRRPWHLEPHCTSAALQPPQAKGSVASPSSPCVRRAWRRHCGRWVTSPARCTIRSVRGVSPDESRTIESQAVVNRSTDLLRPSFRLRIRSRTPSCYSSLRPYSGVCTRCDRSESLRASRFAADSPWDHPNWSAQPVHELSVRSKLGDRRPVVSRPAGGQQATGPSISDPHCPRTSRAMDRGLRRRPLPSRPAAVRRR